MTPLNVACRRGRKEVVKVLLTCRANKHISDKFSYYPIHNATLWGYEDIVVILLENGANPNVINVYGFTPLFLAVNETANTNIAEILIKYNADVNFFVPKSTMPLLMGMLKSCYKHIRQYSFSNERRHLHQKHYYIIISKPVTKCGYILTSDLNLTPDIMSKLSNECSWRFSFQPKNLVLIL